jgi:glyoxylase-like metal-dependent hydrolase (beta-lactamase superfamily II)
MIFSVAAGSAAQFRAAGVAVNRSLPPPLMRAFGSPLQFAAEKFYDGRPNKKHGGGVSQVPGYYRRQFGDAMVTAISDGHLGNGAEILQGVTEERKAEILRETFRDPLDRLALNCFVIQQGGRTALVDAGASGFQPSTGRLLANLAAAGIAPEQVDTILLTHLHPDHVLGVMADGKPVFPNASLHVHENDHAFWHKDEARAATPEGFRVFFDIARGACAVYGERFSTFKDGEVFPGVQAVPLPGHTPGHTGYQVGEGEQALLIWGDIFHIPEIQVRHPEANLVFDVDPQLGVQTRQRTLDRVATDRLMVAGMHLAFPAFSHVGRSAGGYVLVPEFWQSMA